MGVPTNVAAAPKMGGGPDYETLSIMKTMRPKMGLYIYRPVYFLSPFSYFILYLSIFAREIIKAC